ncbi:Cytochrome P450 [Sinosporangium album]|uniref:Cytochrome P450 n=1 Tax=Sinosporangium album TaxID=504805 RepID=A0A1G8CNF7_9ACTN|nr:cytochrome P450 [Sinosporangium album]SDH46833.1 Cytochrome P450 [Sinosporangium album]
MSAAVSNARPKRLVSHHRLFARLLRDPLGALEDLGRQAGGDVAEVRLGWFTGYLVTHPDHVQHVLKGNHENYIREGMFWRPLRRLLGNGILIGEGRSWEHSRKVIQPFFTSRSIHAHADVIIQAVGRQVDRLDEAAASGRTLDALTEMNRILSAASIRIFFGDRLTPAEVARLVPAYDRASASVVARLLLPFVPDRFPLPGDRAFRRATRDIDDVVYSLVERTRRQPDGDDVISVLCRAQGDSWDEAARRGVRDDAVNMIGASLETSAQAMVWLWPVLHQNPEVASAVQEEIDRVVGAGPVTPEHLPQLQYVKAVLQEVLRVYPSGWLFPRMALREDTIGGVRIAPGGNVLISPYVTQRMEGVWDDPLAFKPERFLTKGSTRHHRYAYFPFGGGPHTCVGNHMFLVSATLVAATILSRYRPVLVGATTFTPAPGAALRMRERVNLALIPR